MMELKRSPKRAPTHREDQEEEPPSKKQELDQQRLLLRDTRRPPLSPYIAEDGRDYEGHIFYPDWHKYMKYSILKESKFEYVLNEPPSHDEDEDEKCLETILAHLSGSLLHRYEAEKRIAEIKTAKQLWDFLWEDMEFTHGRPGDHLRAYNSLTIVAHKSIDEQVKQFEDMYDILDVSRVGVTKEFHVYNILAKLPDPSCIHHIQTMMDPSDPLFRDLLRPNARLLDLVKAYNDFTIVPDKSIVEQAEQLNDMYDLLDASRGVTESFHVYNIITSLPQPSWTQVRKELLRPAHVSLETVMKRLRDEQDYRASQPQLWL